MQDGEARPATWLAAYYLDLNNLRIMQLGIYQAEADEPKLPNTQPQPTPHTQTQTLTMASGLFFSFCLSLTGWSATAVI
jgi:hypothetical protein